MAGLGGSFDSGMGGSNGRNAHGVSLRSGSSLLFIVSLALIGLAVGALRLIKAAAADVYPSHSRTRGIGLVQLGGLAGAWVGLILLDLTRMRTPLAPFPWFAAALVLVALALLTYGLLRPDPLQLSQVLEVPKHALPPLHPPRSVFAMVRDSRLLTAALISVCAVYGVMVMDMSLAGTALSRAGVAPRLILIVMAIHFTGMFCLMRLAGQWADRYDRKRLVVGGLALVAVATAGLGLMSVDVINIAGLLFAVGVGWCLAWVAGLGALAEYARTNERGALIGLADLGSDVIAAVLAIAGGAALASLSTGGLSAVGVAALLMTLAISLSWWPALGRTLSSPETD